MSGILQPLLRPVLQPVLHSVLDPPMRGGGLLKAILKLFANGEQGGMWDFTSPKGLYQDALGTTPVTAVGQPVGLVLDRRFGLARGPELIAQPIEFASPAWAKPPGVAESSGLTIRSTITGTISAPVLEVGKTYELKASFLSSTASTTRIYNNSVGVQNPVVVPTGEDTPDGTYIFTAADESIGIRLGGSGEAVISSFSIRELPGNHLSQDTTAARPTYTEDGALHDGVDDRIQAANAEDWTFLHDGTGGFMGASSIYLGGGRNLSGYYGTQLATAASIGISQGQQNPNLARSQARLAGDGGELSMPASSTESMPVGVVASEMLQHANSHIVRWLNGVEFMDTPYDGFVPSANDPQQAITTHISSRNQMLVRRRMLAINRVLTESEIALVNAWLMEGVE